MSTGMEPSDHGDGGGVGRVEREDESVRIDVEAAVAVLEAQHGGALGDLDVQHAVVAGPGLAAHHGAAGLEQVLDPGELHAVQPLPDAGAVVRVEIFPDVLFADEAETVGEADIQASAHDAPLLLADVPVEGDHPDEEGGGEGACDGIFDGGFHL